MAKRKKLKKQVYYVLVIILIIIVIGIFGLKKYQEYKYHQTFEYKLLTHGYSDEEVNTILKKFPNENDINYFLNEEKNSDLVNLTKEKYYLSKNFYQYVEYLKSNPKTDLSTIIRDINIHLNEKFYETNYPVNVSQDIKILVNKYYVLASDYEPTDLVNISQDYSWGELGSKRVRKIAYDAFKDMWDAANKEEGYYLMVNSAYRSYQDQESVYESYKSSRGQKYADSIAARPGSSEHQTGLALDIFSKNNSNKSTFKDSKEANWLKDNAHRFGFILRYPEDKENITGYGYEAWHFRYVGIDIATYIHNNNITFEEYFAYYIEK